ncbi:MAG: trypsin-like peptidase domain-containing protein [Clostridia bacterium]|jgi:serine protease Do|nr:trypsin-like peptidase domain-containing protein [Clostridia bacterium]
MSMDNDDFDDMEKSNHFYDDYNKNEEVEQTSVTEENVNNTENSDNSNSCENEKDDNEEEKLNEMPEHPQKKETYYKETIKSGKKKHGSFRRFIAVCVVISLFGGAGAGAAYSVVNNMVFGGNTKQVDKTTNVNTSNDKVDSNTSNKNVLLSSSDINAAEDVIDEVYPSVVNITINVSGTTDYFGMNVPYESQGAGSGVIFNQDDKYVYIVTNNHVVENANTIKVSVTGTESIDASVVGTDSSNDLAVIKALKSDFNTKVKYSVAKFGDSDKLRVGESVIAIGNALGEGKSATGGMVSVLNKSLNLDGKELNVIQTSSPINPGNSGGALVNYDGEVIGINTAKTSTTVAEGMGYAIPSNTVKKIMENLLENGTSPKPYLGIMGSDITNELSDLYKLPVGVLVREVFDGSPASKAGLKQGDIITSINGNSVMNMQELIDYLNKTKVGDKAELNIVRENKSVTITITIGDANANSEKSSNANNNQ